MEIKRGDVVLMVVPRDSGRPRPGIVVQSDQLNTELSTVFICPITTDVHDKFPLRPLIDPNPDNGLRLRSQIMVDKMAAIRRADIRKIIGRIDETTAVELDHSQSREIVGGCELTPYATSATAASACTCSNAAISALGRAFENR